MVVFIGDVESTTYADEGACELSRRHAESVTFQKSETIAK